ncbi:uncharacterized protein HGUI_00455 [Hanseniaspora guilliermondii]|uniref:Protein CMS1 n=1 Tax=Hanseniaspora guilliermondii TaxID=56406 RepID=A0A1L0CU35_9ASCO|nr:uncharacterized protein HGUI_00455 [Hanseniaspora guilliermondii]
MGADDLEDNLDLGIEEQVVAVEESPASESIPAPSKRNISEVDSEVLDSESPKAKKSKNKRTNNLSSEPEFVKNFATLPIEQILQYFNVNMNSEENEIPFLFSKNDFKDTSIYKKEDRKLTKFNKFLETFINQRDAKTKTVIIAATNIRVADIYRAVQMNEDETNSKVLKGVKLFNKNKLKQDIDTIVNISKSKDEKYKLVKNYITTPVRLMTILNAMGDDKKYEKLWLKDKSKLDIVIDVQFLINSAKNVSIINDFQTVYQLLDVLKALKKIKGNSLRIVLY